MVLSPATPAAAALVLGPWYDVVRANAVKVAIVLALTFAALIVFQASSLIEWIPGLVLGVGNMIGAWLGTHVAVNKGTVWVRWFVIVVCCWCRRRSYWGCSSGWGACWGECVE